MDVDGEASQPKKSKLNQRVSTRFIKQTANWFLDVSLVFVDGKKRTLSENELKLQILKPLKQFFGEVGSAIRVDVLKFNSAVGRAVLKCPAEGFVKVRSALIIESDYCGATCFFKVHRVAATVVVKEEEGDVCEWVHMQKELFLQPHYFGNVQKGVLAAIDILKNTYQQDLGGVVLRHKNVRLLNVDGSIPDDECLLRLSVEADFEVFKPREGALLKGVVNRVSEKHVSCLVYDVFNISCPRGLVPEGEWLGEGASVNDEIYCKVTKVDLMGRLPYIRAEIEEIKCKEELEEVKVKIEVKEEEEEVSPVKKKKRKSRQEEEKLEEIKEEEEVKEEEGADSDLETSHRESKKRRKSKRREEDEEVEVVSDVDTSLRESKKKKKSKREKEVLDESELDSSQSESKKKRKKRKSEDVEEAPVVKKRRKSTRDSD